MKRIHLFLSLSFHWNRELLPGIARFARNQGDWELRRLPAMAKGKVNCESEGVIGIFSKTDEEACAELRAAGIPLVGVSGYDPIATIPLVNHDDFAIGRMAARYLAQTPVRDFAVVTIPQARNAVQREQGFRDELKRMGIDRPVHAIPVNQNLKDSLSQLSPPTAVFAVNDQRAFHFAQTAGAAGFRIPSDFLVLGVDNDPVFCDLSPVPLSSVRLRFEQAGWEAASMLHQLIEGKVPEHPVVALPPKDIEVRRSTEYLIVEDVLVRRAIALMKERMGTLEGFNELAQALGVSRRHLEYRFSAATDSSLGKTLRRLRMERARQLLISRPMRIQEIADAVGIGDVNRFSTYFRKSYGMPPSAYRTQTREPR